MESINVADFEHLAEERLDPGLFDDCRRWFQPRWSQDRAFTPPEDLTPDHVRPRA